MGLRQLEMYLFFQRGDLLKTSECDVECDVYIRHIVTSKVGPRAERVDTKSCSALNPFSAGTDFRRQILTSKAGPRTEAV